jgi:hypothetical protein
LDRKYSDKRHTTISNTIEQEDTAGV